MEYKARKVVIIPGGVGGRKVMIKTEVMEGDSPWIIGKDWMIENELTIDTNRREVRLGENSKGLRWREGVKGHLRIDMRQRRKERGWYESGWIRDKAKWGKGVRKLHLQFGHASKEKIQRLIDEAYGKREKREDIEGCKRAIEKVCNKCEAYIKLRRNPDKSVVGRGCSQREG